MIPTREAGLARLAAFAPLMGTSYAAQRNFDAGQGAHQAVSGLSPWISHRLLTEDEVIAAAFAAHGATEAEKYIQEVLWRTYWKGWLEQHPQVWRSYSEDVAAAWKNAAGDVADVEAGRTGIACMDAWARELVETGYLHNHARMWFASIWCFTLCLPWQLGADLFLRHLLDADAASNTLSWRWIAGLQTQGKHYIARAENIARYTSGRFNPVGQLNESPMPLPAGPPAPRRALPATAQCPPGRIALLLHEDDLLAETLPLAGAEVVAIAGIVTSASRSPACCAPGASAWSRAAVMDGLARAAKHFGVDAILVEDVASWSQTTSCTSLVTPYAPVGWTAEQLNGIEAELVADGIRIHRIRRTWDCKNWPHAQSGFFKFRAALNK